MLYFCTLDLAFISMILRDLWLLLKAWLLFECLRYFITCFRYSSNFVI